MAEPRDDLEEKYELVELPGETSGVFLENPQTITYYYRIKKYPYVVNYLLKDNDDDDTNNIILSTQKTEEILYDYGTVINSEEEIIEIDGYTFNSLNVQNLKITGENNIINVYYEKDRFNYKVEYYYDGVKAEEKTETGTAEHESQITTYEDKNIPGYKFDHDDGPLTISENPEDNVIKVYYTKRTDLSYTVHYYEEGGTTEVAPDKTEYNKTFGELITEEAIDVPEYNKVEPTKVDIEITEGVNEITFYYIKKISTGVIAKYIDINSEKVIKDEIFEGHEHDPYKTDAKEIEGYDLAKNKDIYTEEELEEKGLDENADYIPENAEGLMGNEVIEVKYYYVRKMTVKVEYIDNTTNESLKEIKEIDDDNDGQIDRTEEVDSSIIIEGHVGEKYKAEEKVFENYELIEDKKPGNAEGTMEIVKDEEGKEITEILVRYYYGTKAEVIEKHIDIKTNKPIEEKTYEGYIGDSYKTEEKQIEGYDIVKNKDIYTAEELENKGLNAEDKYIPENSEGNMENTKTEVDYYYIRKTTIKVEYIDKNTGELITQEIPIEEGHEGDLYETEEKEFEDYKLVIVPEDKEGVMEVEKDEDGNLISTEKVIKYYYVYKSAGVIEKHIDLETGEPIEEEKKYTGYEGDEYEIKPKEIKGYEIVEEKLPENSKGTMDREGIEVIYYYKKVKEETPEPTKEIPEQNTDDGDSNNNLTDSNGRTTIINNNYPTERDRNTDSSSNNTKILATPSYISLDNTNDINNSNNSKFNESKQQEKMVETPSAGDNLPVAVFNIVIALIVLNTLITLVASKNKK